jgi:bacterioferritin-associated ferredoxin
MMLHINKVVLLTVFLVILETASANSLLDWIGTAITLPDSCRSFLLSKANDTAFNECLPLSSILPVVSNTGLPEINDLEVAAGAICRAPACSNAFVKDLRTQLETQCGNVPEDAKSLLSSALYVLDNYTPLRDAICVRDKDGSLCTVKFYQQLRSNLGITNLNSVSGKDIISQLPKESICTECNQNILEVLIEADEAQPGKLLPSAEADEVKNALKEKCGASFLNAEDDEKAQDGDQIASGSAVSGPQTFLQISQIFAVIVGIMVLQLL